MLMLDKSQKLGDFHYHEGYEDKSDADEVAYERHTRYLIQYIAVTAHLW